MIKYIYNYFTEFVFLIMEPYSQLLEGFFFDSSFNETFIGIYNLYAFNSLKIYFFLFNVEEIKFEHDKNFVKEKD